MRLAIPTTLRGRALLAAAVVIIAGLLYLLVSLYIVNTALVAERNEIEERPEDFGLRYDEVEFSPRDWPELTLRGWWLPAEDAKGVVIRVHGLDGTRDSSLGLSKALVEGGYSVLVFDLRGHGESDIAQMGAGIHEQDDLRGAIDYVLTHRGAEPGRILVYGDSFGGAIALMTAVDEPGVVGLFSDSSFTSVSDLLIQEVADRTRAARWSATALRPGILFVANTVKGLDINEVRPVDSAGLYEYPLGLAHCRADERVPLFHLAQIREQLQEFPHMVIYEDCEHSQGWEDYTDHYEAFLLNYFDERLGL
ncbi:MAG: alpha/beta fold hydrolase [Chloroflexota bacterium]|nr:alpha/beta fold hydrolase [Chloroflexota bacterium]MDE2886363.1 alpha/beta fold hydrolase [Chloroflexota bacterium]